MKYTTEIFINKAKQIHGDKYDYSKAEYVDSQTKLVIVCPEHGSFAQTPNKHLIRKQGCPACGKAKQGLSKRCTTEEIIMRAQMIHGDLYDYSEVEYKDNKTPITIICPRHGRFEQNVNNHLKGSGCPVCAGRGRRTTVQFIMQANEKHGDKYDYSKSVFISAKTPTTIICPIHGEFLQSPTNHLNSNGCPQCGASIKASKRRKTTADFVSDARKIHGNKYDYSKVEYTGTHNKVVIICPDHGEFEQEPNAHIRGQGCPICGAARTGMKRRTTKDEFIDRAIQIHGAKYNYSNVDYQTQSKSVTIICPNHGPFQQTPNNHLQGRGCPVCGRESTAKAQTKSQEEFIAEATMVHGNRYDYSRSFYSSYGQPLTIICPDHGEFSQQPGVHLSGCGCPKCGRDATTKAETKTKEEFIVDARRIHGDKYDYSESEYVNSNTKLVILCPEHGAFEQMPGAHIAGCGCPKCSGRYMDTSYFIEKARAVHGDRYDYSKAVFVHSMEKVCIICPEHGAFWQAPNHHLSGRGCIECGKQRIADAFRKSLSQFLAEARAVHGDRYDYSLITEYNGQLEKIKIVCPEHGVFEQTPKDHLKGHGCARCAGKGYRITTDEFIGRSRKVHGDKYDYSMTKYINAKTKVKIICPEHGVFEQIPDAHSRDNGCGCPKCKESLLERDVRIMLEDMNEPYVYEKKFEWLHSGKKLMTVDFYLPNRNKAIECQGVQHFKHEPYFHKTEADYRRQLKRDDRKNRQCHDNSVELLYYAYDEEYTKGYKYPLITDIEALRQAIVA